MAKKPEVVSGAKSGGKTGWESVSGTPYAGKAPERISFRIDHKIVRVREDLAQLVTIDAVGQVSDVDIHPFSFRGPRTFPSPDETIWFSAHSLC